MKELYISPELEILCFEAMEQLANVWGNTHSQYGNSLRASSEGLSTENSLPGDIVDDNVDMDPLH